MKRRDFFKVCSAALASQFAMKNETYGDVPDPVVWEVEGVSQEAIPALFDAMGGIDRLISVDLARATILLKPNICLPHTSDFATTTSPELVESLCTFLIAAGAKKIIVADHTLRDAKKFANIELFGVVERFPEVRLILTNEQRLFAPVEVEGKVLKTTEALKMLQRADLFINLPTAKHHSATKVSLAIKNLMGLVWDRSVFHTDMDLGQAIGDLAKVIRPHLNIVDASRVLLDGGPTGPGPVIKDNRLFASMDMVAVDSIVTSRYNFGGRRIRPQEVSHLSAAYDHGIGEIDPEKIQLEKLVT